MDERKYMSDREILEKIHKSRQYMFNRGRKEKVMDMLYKYKGAFILRMK